MLAAVAGAGLIVAASLALGQALLGLSGRRNWTPLAGGVGLAAVIVVAALAAKLPGRAATAAVTVGLLSIVAVAYLGRSRPANGPRLLRIALPVALLRGSPRRCHSSPTPASGCSGSPSSTTTWPTTC